MNPEEVLLNQEPIITLEPEDLPDLDQFVIEDGRPVDNVVTEKQQRLLTEPLYVSWAGPGGGRPWVAFTNVGLFFMEKQSPVAPDMMLGVDVEQGSDWSQKANRSYFVWLRGRPPAVAIEIVSDTRGEEETHKMRLYARAGVFYYVIFDPWNILGQGVLRGYALDFDTYQPTSLDWLPHVGLGLKLWEGEYEGQPGLWLRWCDKEGKVLPTGREKSDQEHQRAEQEKQRAEQLRAQLRALGAEPEA
ncbi:MAG TPA: Uma2 family endonuclease [Gemmataceae bacterium]|nr:Uma2 family endonuclease [Gemmataceae bacterium]